MSESNGDIGIRNDLFIVPLVGCINGLADNIAKAVEKEGLLPEGSKVTVLSHPYGCSQLGDDLANTRGILQNYVAHPNAGGVLVPRAWLREQHQGLLQARAGAARTPTVSGS